MVILEGGTKTPLKILILDQNPILAGGMCRLLSEDGGLIATARNTFAASDLGLRHDETPEVVVIDPEQTDLTASDLVARFTIGGSGASLIGYSASASVELSRACFKAGFRGYLPKSAGIDTMRRAILVIANGGVYLDDAFSDAMSSEPAATSRYKKPALSSRELFVLKLVAHGMTLKEISNK
jgi:DNA-binding NarL/FixJ family response regulator